VQTLSSEAVPVDVRKIANIVLQHLEDLIPLSTAHGQRVKRVVQLAQVNWHTISPSIQPVPDQEANQPIFSSKLKTLSVGPFRGFARKETFDLSSDIVLLYGPNGTGKSSFCEALEYGLLGSVVEAVSKRFMDQRGYFKNAHTNAFDEPEIIGLDGVRISPNESVYRFSFVEKNRIDSFSRIAAQAPAKQIELISTLFGLDLFNEFVRNFTTEVSSKYIDLEGDKAKLLADKLKSLAVYKEQIATSEAELNKLETEESTLTQQYRDGVSFSHMLIEINGTTEELGAICKLEAELQSPIMTKSNLSIVALQALGQSVGSNLAELASKQNDLVKASQDVSFKQLYEALLEVQAVSLDSCPACKTPLNQTVVNPYTHAHGELESLKHLAVLQSSVQSLWQATNQQLLSVSQMINMCCGYFPTSILQDNRLEQGVQPSVEWWNVLHQSYQGGHTPWQHLEAQVQQLEENDKAIDLANQDRATKQVELNRLRSIATQAVALSARRDAICVSVAKAMGVVASFNVENAQLIADVESETVTVAKNKSIAEGYRHFVGLLNSYKNSLPSQLVADMGELVVTLYNAFNRNDSLNDQLSVTRLPLAQHDRLEISFVNNPEVFFDALHVLSEGHIRCLGLAILMAKNIKENCSLLIFDDPVNAIDDDHRESIRLTLFEDQFFQGRQIILTCHGEEFFKDIQNLLSVEQVAQSKMFSFLPRMDEQHILVDYNCSPRNYIVVAKAHIEKGEIRDALGKSRQALESLSKAKLWQYVSTYGDGNLSIKMRSAKASIELRNLTEQLKKKITETDFSDPHKESVLNPINTLLGINGDSREWRYLNKGTHDEADRAEFDRNTVRQIVTCLEQLDAFLQ
jgi:hypothetical protein